MSLTGQHSLTPPFHKPPQAAQSLAASLYPSQMLHRAQETITKALSCKRLWQLRTPAMRHEAQTGDSVPQGARGLSPRCTGIWRCCVTARISPEHCHKSWGRRLGPERCQELSPAEGCPGCQRWGAPIYPTWGTLPLPPQPRHELETKSSAATLLQVWGKCPTFTISQHNFCCFRR